MRGWTGREGEELIEERGGEEERGEEGKGLSRICLVSPAVITYHGQDIVASWNIHHGFVFKEFAVALAKPESTQASLNLTSGLELLSTTDECLISSWLSPTHGALAVYLAFCVGSCCIPSIYAVPTVRLKFMGLLLCV